MPSGKRNRVSTYTRSFELYRNGDGPSITASTSVQHENEYEIPVVNARTSEGRGASQAAASSNVYTVPNVSYPFCNKEDKVV